MRNAKPPWKRMMTGLVCLVLGSATWMPLMHLPFRRPIDHYFGGQGIAPGARQLAARHLALWQDPELRAREIRAMRRSNAEWDFMGRTYFVLALTNMALREPEEASKYLDVVDTIIDETLRLEAENGIYYFLMDYARYGQFVAPQRRSIFQDGEIALMLAARQAVIPKANYVDPLRERIDIMLTTMKESPVLCAESYPNECWMFCNSVAIAAIRMSDVVLGTDHQPFINQWLAKVKRMLRDPDTGLLVSSFRFSGHFLDGPEGSSIWMVAHCLELVDPAFARNQYDRARRELGRSLLGFGYAREWPERWQGPMDIDSGPIIPILEMSPGASGLAVLAAAAFGDREYLSGLTTSLFFGGFPERSHGQLRFHASNQVGDAVLLYAMVQGPLWDLVRNAGAAPETGSGVVRQSKEQRQWL